VLDLNTATVSEIASQLGVTVPEAYDLQLWRPYLDWLEVEMVSGFDAERVQHLRAAGAEIVVPEYADWHRPAIRPN
jgi:hypothetical protein